MRTANPTDMSKAQAAFFASVISSFTSEGTHTLRRYIQTTGDTKKLTTFLLKGQRTAEAGAAFATRALKENDFREKQGLLSEASRIFGLGKETAFHKSSTDDYVELLKDRKYDDDSFQFFSLHWCSCLMRDLLNCMPFSFHRGDAAEKVRLPGRCSSLHFGHSDHRSSPEVRLNERRPPRTTSAASRRRQAGSEVPHSGQAILAH